jgi:tetratricopeptide (TPR) repeat protein
MKLMLRCIGLLGLASATLMSASAALSQSLGPQVQSDLRQGMDALQRGEFGSAEQHLSRVLKARPGLSEVRANLGLAYYADHRYADAVQAFSQALKENASLATAREFLPLSLAGANRCPEAVPGLRRQFASGSDEKLRRIQGLSLQRCLVESGQQAEADQVMQELLAKYPDDVDVLYEAGQMYAKLSSSLYLRLMQIAPHTVRGYQLMGEVSAAQNDWPAAIRSYRQAAKLEPKQPGLHLRLAELMLEHPGSPDDWKQAVEDLKAELEIDPTSADAEYEIGEAYRKHDELEDAEPALRKAIALDPRLPEPRLALAKVLRADHHAQEALSILEPARAAAPDNAAVHFLLAQLYRDVGRTSDAEKEMNAFQRLQPEREPLANP